MLESIPGKERYVESNEKCYGNRCSDLKQANGVTEHMMTCYPAEVRTPGELIIHYKVNEGQQRDFVIRYDSKQMEADG